MAAPAPTFEGLKQRLGTIADNRGYSLRILPGNTRERMPVEIDSKRYLIFFPNSALELTPGSIAKRVANWPHIRGHRPAGYVILAKRAELANRTVATDGRDLPSHVAVVGAWGTRNRLVASDIDVGMSLILEAASIPLEDITRLLQRAETTEQAPEGNVSSRTPYAQWGPSPRRGTLLDAYRLEKRLGRGHSAEVWKATLVRTVPGVDLSIGASVAVKIYLPGLLQDFEALRIQREFSIATDIQHPNLATVFDLVLSPSRPFHTFMVMEYIDGPSLKDYISQHGSLSVGDTYTIARQIFMALAELHSLSAVHRDVKAANIIVASQLKHPIAVKLVDLGIVSVAAERRFTIASSFLGSKHSAPLEQLVGDELDERTDIYGAGSVLFNCLKGTPMYDGVGPEGAIVRKMLNQPEELIWEMEGDELYNASFIDFINQCIRVNAAERPKTAAGCLELLDAMVKKETYFGPTPTRFQ
jgi:hypothetical protein